MADYRNRIVAHGEESPTALVANPANWRTHPKAQAEALAAVLDEVGWVQSVVVNRRTDRLIDGHLRVVVAEQRGVEKLPVVYVDLDEDEEKMILASLDPLASMAGVDGEKLKALLDEIEAEQPALRDMLAELAAKNGLSELASEDDDPGAQIERADELQEKWQVQPGQVWEIGRHRLLCGDSTDSNTVRRFAGDWKADSIVTDPPYGVDYAEKTRHLSRNGGGRARAEIQNDKAADMRAFFTAFLEPAPLASRNTAFVFMSGQELHNLRLAIEDAGFTWGDYLIWVKDSLVLSRKDYNARHEFLVYGWKGRHKFFGPTTSTTVLEYARPKRSVEHPTMKPVALVGRLLQDGSPIRGKIYEPFAGSGTTFVATEQTGRSCYGIEIEPKYCAVTLERLTGMGLEPRLAE